MAASIAHHLLAVLTALEALNHVGGTTTELTHPVEKLASAGTHTLTIGAVDFATYPFETRGFDGGVPGPTFRMFPGETLSINLVNNLDNANNLNCAQAPDAFCETATTNLHTHGLHVSSKGKEDGWSYYSDDIFADVSPGNSELFQFEIPDFHMPGTHWYHPHHHHATALQAGGGAAGLLIVNDPVGYLPDIYANMPEKVMMISGHNLQTLETMADAASSGLLQDAVSLASNAGLPTNLFLVNGQIGPTLTMPSHTWHRFRMVYAAVEQSINFEVTGSDNGGACQFQLLAKDGVYLPTFPRSITYAALFPGARADIAVSCTCTTYPCTINIGSSGGNRRLAPRRLQKPPPPGGDGGAPPDAPGGDMATADYLALTITETANGVVADLPATTVDRPCYLVDLQGVTVPQAQRGSLALQGGERRVQWNGAGESMTYDAVHANGGTKHTWPAIATLTVGNVYEITVTGAHAHPLHMHINPYQIVELPGGPYEDGYFQVGDWHDTLLIDALGGQNTVTVRTHLDYFTGKLVIHCHILEHEDEGMMAFIDVTGTDGTTWSGAEGVDPQCRRGPLGGSTSTTGGVTTTTAADTSMTTVTTTMITSADTTTTLSPAGPSETTVTTAPTTTTVDGGVSTTTTMADSTLSTASTTASSSTSSASAPSGDSISGALSTQVSVAAVLLSFNLLAYANKL
eukprot:CAMPEP_0178435136 /NCGR_PEP_ID=MMETSP0689_2-20121128/33774_1 /TAXON_ID=160604 /ORGANISM="Amphidinium massartii, Strain CS-259" /LENGTH=687 /DNA_ID=CAMNT_0020057203 /DNA_START=33 /DNA_END=2096 /DNA_ORIENTATION=+